MTGFRFIARLDIKGSKLIKSIRFEGQRVLGDPQQFAMKYYEGGIDELIYVDTVASLYNRNSLFNIIEYTTKNIFIPFTVEGGIRSAENAKTILRAGAEKVAINTAAVKQPEIISEISTDFGTQSVVLSIQAKKRNENSWEAFTDNGREPSGRNVVEWAKIGQKLGAGEILLTSIDRDGTLAGFDEELIKEVVNNVTIPVIACGGAGKTNDIIGVFKRTSVDAVAVASILHYEHFSIEEIKECLVKDGIEIRQ